MIRKILILIPAFMAAISFAAGSCAAETPVEIISAEFGLFDASNPQELLFQPTDRVPHKVGQRYGWIIEVRTAKRTLAVSEEYLLPTPPTVRKTEDSLDESLDIPVQRRNQVSQRQLVPVDNLIYGEWAIGPNEPAGHRHLQVLIEGQVGASFRYDVK